ncbi:MAG: hypothetical protein KDB22_29430, partial [Planctomycetales bacterium]|nr:hypothetical protein [Planctomycetales bacterium]
MSTHCVATTKRKRLRSRTRRSKLSKLCFEKLFERTLLAADAVELSLILSELDATPGILVGEQFDVSVYFKDLVNNRAVFSGYADINFSSTLVRVDEIIYDSDYGAARTGTIQSGVVNEVGASDGTTPPADTRVFTLRVTALAAGTASFTSDAGESGLSEIVIFGDDNDQRTNTIFGSLQITIEAAASLGSISGQLFDDINANGIQDNSEGFLPSRTFFIDTNLNAVRDAGEPQSLTDQQGRYV